MELLPALESIYPDLRGAARVSRWSTSSGLTIDATGERKEGGQHIYVVLADGSDAERFLKTLHRRAWLGGLGWVYVGTSGNLLERSIIDTSVYNPERLVFEADPSLGAGLSQAPRPATVHNGVPLATPSPLSAKEEVEYQRLVKEFNKRLAPAAKKQRAIWSKGRIERMVASGATLAKAEKTIKQWLKGVLLPDAIIEFTNPALGFVTIRQILEDPTTFDGAICYDPIEGRSYGHATGRFYAKSQTIHSQAHGGMTFHLKGEKVKATGGPEGEGS